ncbi:MAG: hypothetical protein NUV82_02730 [Candidatus Komeilibacteria bacterium]|nr:hypothetical protein [Candidatus Komeilibacteria bacterium]
MMIKKVVTVYMPNIRRLIRVIADVGQALPDETIIFLKSLKAAYVVIWALQEFVTMANSKIGLEPLYKYCKDDSMLNEGFFLYDPVIHNILNTNSSMSTRIRFELSLWDDGGVKLETKIFKNGNKPFFFINTWLKANKIIEYKYGDGK